ncbi:hypothetical protein [Melittangium boletus]|uniref:hypothetical protein n=1 Tax=Melittangium boletus TaxID=83453 RepID=UPI003DA52CA0
MTPWLLALLAVGDVTFSAFRDAAGRDPRIDKTSYFWRAVLGGLACGLWIIALCVALVHAALMASPHPEPLYDDMLTAGGHLVRLYGAFTLLVLAALLLWRLGQSELRTLMTVAILGPLTLLRHALLPVGYVWAVLGAREGATVAVTTVGFVLVGSAERLFGRIRRHRGHLWPGERLLPSLASR